MQSSPFFKFTTIEIVSSKAFKFESKSFQKTECNFLKVYAIVSVFFLIIVLLILAASINMKENSALLILKINLFKLNL